jgi:dynein heavy chain
MDLVLFDDAIDHVVKIHRVITTEGGNMMLVGVGGSGRKSLTALAISIATFETFEIEMKKGYTIKDWRDDLREKLFQSSGVESIPHVFLFSDTQMINEAFVEDINNILNNGRVPNLYPVDAIEEILLSMKDTHRGNDLLKDIQDDNTAIMNLFEDQAKKSIHLVLAMSPIGEDFKRRLRMFPALVNCCTIDWFLPWGNSALEQVARRFMKDVPDLPNEAGIVSICVDMQMRVIQLAERYKLEMRKYYYVTPTSYLILIKTF